MDANGVTVAFQSEEVGTRLENTRYAPASIATSNMTMLTGTPVIVF